MFVESVWEGGIWIVSETEGRVLQQLEGTVIWIEELPSSRDKLIIKGGSKRSDRREVLHEPEVQAEEVLG